VNEALLTIEDLHTHFFTPAGVVKALDGIDLAIKKGQTLGVVGESGCGKTVLSLSILRLVPSPPGHFVKGRILFHDRDLLRLKDEELRDVRGNRISMIFQEPMTALNPVFTIGDQIAEVLLLHQRRQAPTRRHALAMAAELLGTVGIMDPDKRIRDYPHQLSGGMCQRVMIAMALACRPELLIADEPTTALDVTTQAQILALMDQLKTELGSSVMFVTHDLGIVAKTCQEVAVMYLGRVVEYSPVQPLFDSPLHPYTKGLMRSVPVLGKTRSRLNAIRGNVPAFKDIPTGCSFRDRCDEAFDRCMDIPPVFYPEPGRRVRCWRYAHD
jgi:oligopeptide/dipeptide ABC transporter ATP-binding protein